MNNIIELLNDGLKNTSMTIYQELLKVNDEVAAKEKTALLLLSNLRIFSAKEVGLEEIGRVYNEMLDEYKSIKDENEGKLIRDNLLVLQQAIEILKERRGRFD